MQAPPAPRPGQPKAAREHPPPTEAADRHSQLGGLLLAAQKAGDPVERLLAVLRALLCLLSDVLKPGARFADVPVATLGAHYLSHRPLAARFVGDAAEVHLQELVSYDAAEGPWAAPPKLAAPGRADVAGLRLRLAPAARARVRRGGAAAALLGGGGGGGAGGGGAYLEVALEGGGAATLPLRGEVYEFTLPALVLAAPAAEACALDWEGPLAAACAATGLRADLRFAPAAAGERAVRGDVARIGGGGGGGGGRVALVSGSWDGEVTVRSAADDAAGVLFAAADYAPPLPAPAAINLAEPGPRAATRLWAAVLEAALYAEAAPGGGGGAARRAADALVASLPALMKKSLLFEVQEGARPAAPAPVRAPAGGSGGGGGAASAVDAAAAADTRPLPPIIKLERAEGRRPIYTLFYRVQSAAGPPGGDEDGGG